MMMLMLAAWSEPVRCEEPRMSWIDNGRIRLGVDLSIGGAVTHLSEGKDGPNMINSFDWGRQIQMSFYSGPVPFVPKGATVHRNWKALGWNPIQSGDVYAHRSKVTAHRNDDKQLYVRCTPMHWPLKNVPGECDFECWFKLEGNTVQARCRLTNRRPDKTQYPGRKQELPAVYTNGPWYKLVSYLGNRPFTGAEPTVLVDRNDGKGWPWRNFHTPEHWTALLNKDNRGLGIYLPGACVFAGGFSGAKGSGGHKDGPTGYMSPTTREILDHNIVYTYDYTLIVGSLQEIRDHVYQQEKNRGLPSWKFVRDRQHWTCERTDQGWPIRNGLRVRLGPANAMLGSPKTFWRAEDSSTVSLRAAFTTKATTAELLIQTYDDLAAGDWAQWGPGRAARPKPAPPLVMPFTIVGDGQVRTIEVDLSAHPEYRGGMTQVGLRLPRGEGSVTLHAMSLKAPPRRFSVADFGAVGDGVHDDGPAITAAFAAAKADGAASTVVFEKKTYRLGGNPTAWHYFQMMGHEDLVIDGNGATLLCPKANLAFFFDGGRNITVRGLTFDTVQPNFTQGEVVAVGSGGALDVKIMAGYPEPPDEAFLTANGHRAQAGGGRHMIVFEKGGASRNTRLKRDHLYIRNITRVSSGVFRFHVLEDYLPSFADVTVGNWVTYGLNKSTLPAAVVATKSKSGSIYAQIAADRVENIVFEDINIFGSLNGGIRVSDMPGDVTLRNVRIIRKPGTRNLLSTISDALHLMNIRGRVVMEDCVVEAPGDDCLNIGAQRDNVIKLSASDKRTVILRTTDNWYYYYTIRKGDRLQFLDTASKRVLGVRTVTAATFNPKKREHTVTLDREVPGLAPKTTQVMNLNHITQSTVIRNNTITPYMRNALLARAQNMTIEGNTLDCSRGGVIGLNLSYASGQDDARLRNVRVTGNTFVCPDNVALVAWRPYRDEDGAPDTRDIRIIDNIFHVRSARAIRINRVHGLSVRSNRFMANGKPAANPSEFIEIHNCVEVEK